LHNAITKYSSSKAVEISQGIMESQDNDLEIDELKELK
jgi:hypothetical protein